MSKKRPYISPALISRPMSELSESERKTVSSILLEIAGHDYRTVVDLDRRYVEVSDDFCRLVGYERVALIGKRYDDLTAPETTDIHTVFNMFCQLKYMHGLWLLATRSGTRILVRYESWLRPDSLIEAWMQPIGAGY